MLEAALIASDFLFALSVFNSGSGTGMHYGSVSAKAKSCDSCGSGITTLVAGRGLPDGRVGRSLIRSLI